jgi:hypothetical protein
LNLDAAGTVACNHMAAVFYYTDSINTPSPAFAYPCSNYTNFVKGLCTSCGPNGNKCQQAGYRASPDRTLGTLYMMTLDGVKAPHFGMKKPSKQREKNLILIRKVFKERYLFSRFSFRSNTYFSHGQWKANARHL